MKPDIDKEREAFERSVSGPPFERNIARYPEDPIRFSWPGSYRDINVDLAWHLFIAGAEFARASAGATMSANDTQAEVCSSDGLGQGPERGLLASLQSLKVLLGTDAPEVRGWAPVVQREAQATVNAAIAALKDMNAMSARLEQTTEKLADDNERLREALRRVHAAQADVRPTAWLRGVRTPDTQTGSAEYDEECVPGEDQPPGEDAMTPEATGQQPTRWNEEIEPLEWRPEDAKALRCACCGGVPELWQVDREGTITNMVNCERAELAPGKGWPYEQSCPMYSPGPEFNKATRREAIRHWNLVQQTLRKLREQSVSPSDRATIASLAAAQQPEQGEAAGGA